IPVLSYRLGGSLLPGAPTYAGAYGVTVTCGDGGVKSSTVTATAGLTITPAATTTTVTCPASVPSTGSPQTPCTVAVTGPGLSLRSEERRGGKEERAPATASYSFAGGGNYLCSNRPAAVQSCPGT